MLEPGSILGGKYRVGAVLGKGGMAKIVEAVHVQLGTRVAIKVLREDLADRPALVERFLREARAAAQLRGEYVCRVHDFGTLEQGVPFMVMELLQGRDLGKVLRSGGPLEVEPAVRYILQVCCALAEAHARGMVHRDLKPSNLVVVERPDGSSAIKLLDFGIVKSIDTVDVNLTDTTSVMGSPAYMSPEQLKSSKNVDARADIWSLGVLLYELVSGEQPFVAGSLTSLVLNISSDAPAPLPDSVPPGLASVIMRCLEKDPARRYPDVATLAAALAPCASADARPLAVTAARVLTATRIEAPGSTTVAELAGDVAPELSEKVTTIGGASGVLLEGASRSGWRLAIGLGLGVVGVGSLVTALVLRRPAAPGVPPPAAASSPATHGAAPTGPDAGPSALEAVAAPVDAAVATSAVDAPTAEPMAPADAAPAREPSPPRRPHRPKRPTTGRGTSQPADLGKSRY